jgi:hypothetical protein
MHADPHLVSNSATADDQAHAFFLLIGEGN